MASLVPALEDGALDITDPEILSFIATRPDHRLGREIQFLGTARGDNRSLGLLRLLGRLQADHHPGPLPRLAEWTLGQIGPLTARWRNKAKREAVAAETARLAGAGMLTGILALLEDPVEQDRDMAGARRAAEDLTRIDAELAVIEGGGPARGLRGSCGAGSRWCPGPRGPRADAGSGGARMNQTQASIQPATPASSREA